MLSELLLDLCGYSGWLLNVADGEVGDSEILQSLGAGRSKESNEGGEPLSFF